MKYIPTIIFACAIAISGYSQTESGIYLTIQCAKRSPRQTVMLTNKQVCTATNPIIMVTEFTAITGIIDVGDKMSFDLTLSVKAVQKLMQLSASLPNSIFALMVDKSVFYVFPASDIQVGRTFRFQANGKDKSTFYDMHRKLRDVVNARTQ